MNVEQLIEDGWKKHKAEAGIRSDAGFESFRFGVRHALAAMFPVVKVEELNHPDFDRGMVWVKIQEQWEIGEFLWDPDDGGMYCAAAGREFEVHHEDFSEFRRCPTPSELGVG